MSYALSGLPGICLLYPQHPITDFFQQKRDILSPKLNGMHGLIWDRCTRAIFRPTIVALSDQLSELLTWGTTQQQPFNINNCV